MWLHFPIIKLCPSKERNTKKWFLTDTSQFKNFKGFNHRLVSALKSFTVITFFLWNPLDYLLKIFWKGFKFCLSLSLFISHARTHTRTHTHTLSILLSFCPLSHSHTLSLSLTQFVSLSLSHSISHSLCLVVFIWSFWKKCLSPRTSSRAPNFQFTKGPNSVILNNKTALSATFPARLTSSLAALWQHK